MGQTFICGVCGHELPVEYRHRERPGVCFLDYVSEADGAEIQEAIEEAFEMTARD